LDEKLQVAVMAIASACSCEIEAVAAAAAHRFVVTARPVDQLQVAVDAASLVQFIQPVVEQVQTHTYLPKAKALLKHAGTCHAISGQTPARRLVVTARPVDQLQVVVDAASVAQLIQPVGEQVQTNSYLPKAKALSQHAWTCHAISGQTPAHRLVITARPVDQLQVVVDAASVVQLIQPVVEQVQTHYYLPKAKAY
jgi:thioredoxin-like negative regulator of GroEL